MKIKSNGAAKTEEKCLEKASCSQQNISQIAETGDSCRLVNLPVNFYSPWRSGAEFYSEEEGESRHLREFLELKNRRFLDEVEAEEERADLDNDACIEAIIYAEIASF